LFSSSHLERRDFMCSQTNHSVMHVMMLNTFWWSTKWLDKVWGSCCTWGHQIKVLCNFVAQTSHSVPSLWVQMKSFAAAMQHTVTQGSAKCPSGMPGSLQGASPMCSCGYCYNRYLGTAFTEKHRFFAWTHK
jgi:hypothetical protein